MNLNYGLYDRVIDAELREALDKLDKTHASIDQVRLDEGDSHSVLAQCLAKRIERALTRVPSEDRVRRQIDRCNALLELLLEDELADSDEVSALESAGHKLMAVRRLDPSTGALPIHRPETPLALSCLLTGARVDPSLVSQLKLEIAAADSVDILCSFIKWSGVRMLEDALRQLTESRGGWLRVITTSYLGATDLKAVERLAALPNTTVRISYDTKKTRLHAKAYVFRRATGFGTAYIGSANLSLPALTEGLEWVVKVSQYESAHLWEKVRATFETYWEDREFVAYSPEDRDRLAAALAKEHQRPETATDAEFGFDIQPYNFQQMILDKLLAEREIHGRTHNLVVAATGTGKTVIAAFDYRRFQETLRSRSRGAIARLLFIAHRAEILQQARSCFRGVLRDPNFGDLLVGGERPERSDHLFASIQSYNSHRLYERLAPDHYDYVVVDEFHHAPAESYQRLLEFVRPQVLLGLTATPERMDAKDIMPYFGGRVSAEIRLPEAINQQLLSPFQYFGVTDTVDLSGVKWQRGYAAADLEALYLQNDERATNILRAIGNRVLDIKEVRGLGFCVSVRHAAYMADFFRRNGIPAEALDGNSPPEIRRNVQRRLEVREINFIFVVDLYNEGVDLPFVDTVLLLRPTESLTVFLQQLGRGLRLSRDKECLTVLDFIGQAHRSYRFESRFRALMDNPQRRVEREIEEGFPHLPLGCAIHLERQAQRHVLDNIRASIDMSRAQMVQRIAAFSDDTGSDITFANFLTYYELEPEVVYQRGSWARLCAEAGVGAPLYDPDEKILTQGLARAAHIDSAAQINALQSLLTSHDLGEADHLDEEMTRRYTMLHFALWGRGFSARTVEESLARLRNNPRLANELLDLLSYRYEGLEQLTPAVDLPFICPLELHAEYSRDEILAGLGQSTMMNPRELREGVLRLTGQPADALFVTLNKTEKDYSPTTLYEDYALSADLFHWQSQSTTSESSPTGQRYIHHRERGHAILLFMRESKSRNGRAAPYVFAGPVDYVQHQGSRPMSIIWRLKSPLPAVMIGAAVRMKAA